MNGAVAEANYLESFELWTQRGMQNIRQMDVVRNDIELVKKEENY